MEIKHTIKAITSSAASICPYPSGNLSLSVSPCDLRSNTTRLNCRSNGFENWALDRSAAGPGEGQDRAYGGRRAERPVDERIITQGAGGLYLGRWLTLEY